jgi:hypothetical protein
MIIAPTDEWYAIWYAPEEDDVEDDEDTIYQNVMVAANVVVWQENVGQVLGLVATPGKRDLLAAPECRNELNGYKGPVFFIGYMVYRACDDQLSMGIHQAAYIYFEDEICKAYEDYNQEKRVDDDF